MGLELSSAAALSTYVHSRWHRAGVKYKMSGLLRIEVPKIQGLSLLPLVCVIEYHACMAMTMWQGFLRGTKHGHVCWSWSGYLTVVS